MHHTVGSVDSSLTHSAMAPVCLLAESLLNCCLPQLTPTTPLLPALPAPEPSLSQHQQVPNGVLNGDQLRYLGSCIRPYGEDGCADITTRANIQLRGVQLQDADKVIQGLIEHDISSYQSGMDSVRNLTGNPIAGVDPHELIDTR